MDHIDIAQFLSKIQYGKKIYEENIQETEKPFKCGLCGRSFSKKGHFNEHLAKSHTDEKKVACEFCGKLLFDKRALERHVMSQHRKDDCQFQCDFCLKRFTANAVLVNHLKRVHKKEPIGSLIKCHYCSEGFNHQKLLEDHIKRLHAMTNSATEKKDDKEEHRIICDQCSRPFSDTDLLNRHIANVHSEEKRFKCELCPNHKGFGVKSNFNAHMAKVHGAKLPCEFCGKVLHDVKSLRSHVMSKHKRDDCPFQCEICQKKFSKRSYLIRHIEFVHKNDGSGSDLKCDQCEEKFRHQFLLDDHIKKKHEIISTRTSRKCTCQICGKVVQNAKSLKLHILAKHNREDCAFSCDICGKKFPRNSLLVRHTKVHQNGEQIVENDTPDHHDENSDLKIEENETVESAEFLEGKVDLIDYKVESDTVDKCDVDFLDITSSKAINFDDIIETSDIKETLFDKVEEDNEEKFDISINENENYILDKAEFFQCQDCHSVFLSSYELDNHQCLSIKSEATPLTENETQNIKTNQKSFQCNLCEKTYHRKESLRRHHREEHTQPLKDQPQKVRGQGHFCLICNLQFDQIYLLRIHMRKAHDKKLEMGALNRQFKCEFCEKAFFRKESLRRHIRESHEDRGMKIEPGLVFPCFQCDKKYERKDVLRRHVRLVHEAVQAGLCDLCNGAFFRDISRHMVVSHTIENSNINCPICFKSIGKNYSLKRHIRVFHPKDLIKPEETAEGLNPDRNGLCDVCGDEHLGLVNLLRHKKLVHGFCQNPKPEDKSKKFPCPHCGKQIVGIHGLRGHIKSVHDKTKDFMCNECGKCFTQLIGLKTHVKHIHMGIERAFSCKHCDKIFSSPRGRHLHTEKEHKNQFQCQKCRKCFAFQRHFKHHECSPAFQEKESNLKSGDELGSSMVLVAQ